VSERLRIFKYSLPTRLWDGGGMFWDSCKTAANSLGISHKGISDAVNGRIKTTGGFKWEFAQTLDCSGQQC